MDRVVVDVRPRADVLAGRLFASKYVHVPLAELADRWFELPPVQTLGSWVWVVRDAAEEAALRTAIDTRFEGPCPCAVDVVVWADASARLVSEGAVDTGGPVRIVPTWSPSPTLGGVVDRVEAALTSLRVPPPWSVVDVACGSGRDAAFLASRGCWRVTVLDHSPTLLAKAVDLCARYGVPSPAGAPYAAESVSVDLTDPGAVSAATAGRTWHCVHVARFLHKPLLPLLASWVCAGGWVVYMAFADGAQHCGKRTPRNPKHLLFPGELEAAFSPAAGFMDGPPALSCEVPVEDGRPVRSFAAQKAV